MSEDPATHGNAIAFPRLDASDIAALKPLADTCSFQDGQTVFRAGDADLDLFVVESGAIEILNPADDNRHVVTHGPGEFAGDIDLLTRRPVIVTAVARGPTRLLRVAGARLRELLNKVPHLSEIMLTRRSGAAAAAQPGRCPRSESGGTGQMPRYHAGARIPVQEFRSLHLVRLGSRRRARSCWRAGAGRKNRRSLNAAQAGC